MGKNCNKLGAGFSYYQSLWTSRVDHSGPNLFSELFCGTPPSCFDDVLAEDGELLHVLPLAVPLKFFLTDK